MRPILAEVVTIGDEILYGQITDTNSQWMSTELDKIGVKTVRKSSVGDQEDKILQILTEAESRADIVLLTGGLDQQKMILQKKCFVSILMMHLLSMKMLWGLLPISL